MRLVQVGVQDWKLRGRQQLGRDQLGEKRREWTYIR